MASDYKGRDKDLKAERKLATISPALGVKKVMGGSSSFVSVPKDGPFVLMA